MQNARITRKYRVRKTREIYRAIARSASKTNERREGEKERKSHFGMVRPGLVRRHNKMPNKSTEIPWVSSSQVDVLRSNVIVEPWIHHRDQKKSLETSFTVSPFPRSWYAYNTNGMFSHPLHVDSSLPQSSISINISSHIPRTITDSLDYFYRGPNETCVVV